ncbi:Ig-like domain-containing protein, partial [Cohnella sp. 56]|uniref:Ig-like domain-containing protein n=1 Tax=Cohnella sp. 56 TaxID=3113722 RepID=UPI0030EB05B8
GTSTVGEALTGSYTYGDADNDLEDTPAYKWYRGDSANGTGKTEIGGATSASYTLTAEDQGKYIFFEVTPKAKTGVLSGDAKVSAAAGPIAAANVAPVATGDTKQTNMNTAVSGTLSASDANGDTLTYSKVTDPAHGTVTVNSNGTYTYTPTAGYTGPDSFTFKAYDGKAYSNTATVTINVNAPPVATNVQVSGTPTVGEALTGSYTYGDTDNDLEDTPAYKWYRGDNANGTGKTAIGGATSANYTLTAEDQGKYIFFEVTPKAKTGVLSGDAKVSAAAGPIAAANVAPVATGDTKQTNMNTAVSGTLSASDANGDTLTYSKVTDPAQGTVTVNSNGTYTYTPTVGYTGPDSFTFKAYDGKAYSNAATVTIEVNAPPVATNVQVSGTPTVGEALTGSYTYGDTDNDLEDTPAYKWYRGDSANGTGKTAIGGATSANYTLTAEDQGKYIFFEVTPKAKTGVLIGSPAVSAAAGPIAAANVAPVATGDTKQTNMNTAVNGTLSASDANGDTLTYSKATDPAHGTVTVNANGTYTYTPNAGYTGPDSFTFKAYDGKAYSNTATVTINVNNRAPIAIAQDVIISVNGAVYGGELKGSDPDTGDTLTFNKATDPAHGTVKVNENGTYTYTPVPGYSGSDSFTFTVTDSHGATSAPAKVTIAIAEPGTYVIRMAADPDTLIGDGKSESRLTATLLDSDGKPVAGVTIKFAAPSGTFPSGDEAVTNAAGQAVVVYRTSKISSTTAQVIKVTADAHDTEKGIYSSQQIDVTFQPAAIRGVVASTVDGKRLVEPGVTVRISNEHIHFSAETTTDELGQYAVPVPEGDLIYNIEIIKPVTVGGETKQVSFKQTASVGSITGSGDEYFDSEKVATGIVVLAKPDGSQKLLNDQNAADRDIAAQIKIKIQDPDTGEFITINGQDAFALDPSGVFSVPGLVKGKKYGLAIVYSLPDAQNGGAAKEIIMNAVDNDGTLPRFELSADGELNILDELIDPYGDITDKVSGTAVDGAKVVLYYADTPRNRAAGITPGTEVVLPAIPGFAPNDNANPQTSKDGGKYAYMVYPQTDYYLIVTAAGYDQYVSPTIPVEFAIVRHDAPLTPQSGGGTPPPATVEPQPVGTPDLIVNISIDRSTYEESSTATVVVKYKNDGTAKATDAQIVLSIPEGAEVLDAAGGTVSGGEIVWKPGTVEAAAGGQYTVKLKWPQIDAAERMAELGAKATAANQKADGVANAEASVKLLIFSNRYGNVKHTRYILGYPDKTFLPNRTLTRAELAAIIARLIDGGGTTLKAQYSDVRESHWASGYIRIASDNGIFTGYTDGSFHPDSPVTREELAAVMVRYLKLKTAKPLDAKFADAEGRWSSSAIEALSRNALTTGYADGTFKPAAAIVRQEAVTMINRMLYRGPLGGVEASFPDVPKSSWSFGQVEEATRSHEAARAADGSETMVNRIDDNVQ